MHFFQHATALLLLLSAGAALSSRPLYQDTRHPGPHQRPNRPYHPRPHHPKPTYGHDTEYAKCQVKTWSSDTELCQPELERDCERVTFDTKVITWPGFDGYHQKPCEPTKLPRCSVTNDAENFRLCSCKVKVHEVDLYATMFEQELVKRCDTHYVTECRPGYSQYAPKKCETRPKQVRV